MMNEEQRNVLEFYKQFISWRSESIGLWVGAGLLVVFMLIGCSVPVQEIFDVGKTDGSLIIGISLFSSLMAGWLYIRPYQSYMENQKTQSILAKLKYMPVDFKQIRKMKRIYLVRFFGIILPFGLVLQMLTSWYSYGEITWANVGYVVVTAFLWPLLGNLWILMWEK